MGRAIKLRDLIGVVKDKASLSRAALLSTPNTLSLQLAVLRATTHSASTAPDYKQLDSLLSLGDASRATASALVQSLMDRLHRTGDSSVALKCLFTIHYIIKHGPFILQDQLSIFPAAGGRNYLNLSAFRDGANPTTWALSAWVRWYARYLETLLSTSRILGFFLCSSSSTAEKDKQEERLASLMNVDLIRDAGSLVSLIEELCDMPDSLLVEGNKLLHEVMGFVCGDYLSAVNEVVSRLSEFRVRVNCMSFGESVELMKVLRRLENCKERLGLVFTVNKPSTEALWGLVEELKSGVGIVMADGEAISLGRREKGTGSARFNSDRVLKHCESVEFSSERFELNKLSSMGFDRGFSSSAAAGSEMIRATLFPGDGIGPEIADSVKEVFKAAEVLIEWEEHYVGQEIDPRTQSFLTWESLESVRRNKVGLKGPMATPIGKGHRSLNLTLRKELNLYANVRPCYSLPGYKTRYDDVNLITIRENTEGEYSGLEHQVVRGVVESLKIITRQASLRVAEYAFHYAKTHGRERVSAIHKANIMQKTDGLFLKCCREVAEKYPEINYEEVIIDNCCMMLVKNPNLFDVLVMPNLYGDIVSDLCAGLIGGLGLTPSCNIGEGGIALAEAVHGSAPDIAGKNLANPTALLLSAVTMLHHLEMHDKAERIQEAILKTIAEGKYRTADLGGSSSTSDFTKAIIGHL